MSETEDLKAAKRRHGSRLAALDDWVQKREQALAAAIEATARANDVYRAACADANAHRGVLELPIAPGRRSTVTPTLPVLLDEHPPHDLDPSRQRLIAVTQRETAERAARMHASAKVAVERAGLTKLVDGTVPF